MLEVLHRTNRALVSIRAALDEASQHGSAKSQSSLGRYRLKSGQFHLQLDSRFTGTRVQYLMKFTSCLILLALKEHQTLLHLRAS